MIIATCGHKVDDIDSLYDLQLQDYTSDGDKCISYVVFCKDCADQYEKEGLVIHTKEEESTWLQSPPVSSIEIPLLEHARELSFSTDVVISSFAKRVVSYIEASTESSILEILIDTDNSFTLLLGNDASVTGIGKMQFKTPEEAIFALEHASITWVRPIKAYTPDGPYTVDSDDQVHFAFVINMCMYVASMIRSGNYDFIDTYGPYRISVSLSH